ncbi:hypothetical protein IT412_02820 [Candidatus Peregrinibacteria bacterium]|nr:hypothetical protein [Candidatus Peregrinibacteria bacterium]
MKIFKSDKHPINLIATTLFVLVILMAFYLPLARSFGWPTVGNWLTAEDFLSQNFGVLFVIFVVLFLTTSLNSKVQIFPEGKIKYVSNSKRGRTREYDVKDYDGFYLLQTDKTLYKQVALLFHNKVGGIDDIAYFYFLKNNLASIPDLSEALKQLGLKEMPSNDQDLLDFVKG